MENLLIFTDGGARGNPGPAAVGVVIKYENGAILHQFGKRIGKTTNNVAEYTGVVEALRYVLSIKYKVESINFFLDSKLVVNQLNGLFKIKDAHLRELLIEVHELEAEIGGKIIYQQIPREENRLADSLVNKALDNMF